jgi:hypothetical protein
MKATNFTAYAVSDLYKAGHSCDGHAFFADQFYVLIENEACRRFRHQAIFNGAEVICNEDTDGEVVFKDVRAEALAKAEALAARVNAAIKAGVALDSSRWEEVDAAYGSDAYVSQGTEASRAFQDRQAA